MLYYTEKILGFKKEMLCAILIFKIKNANSRLFGELGCGCLVWLPCVVTTNDIPPHIHTRILRGGVGRYTPPLRWFSTFPEKSCTSLENSCASPSERSRNR